MHTFTVVMCACALGLAAAEDKYTDKYDNFDVDALLSNARILQSYINCLINAGPCTPEGKEFKTILPDALETSCTKCTASQKNIIRKMSKHIIENKPADWEKLVAIYDKDDKYKESFQKFMAGDD